MNNWAKLVKTGLVLTLMSFDLAISGNKGEFRKTVPVWYFYDVQV